jgi:hypothetical protein
MGGEGLNGLNLWRNVRINFLSLKKIDMFK